MSTNIRYKRVSNTIGAALTAANFPYSTDGDNKQLKFIKRVIVAADIGAGAGQTGHASGAIVDIIPNTTNVLWIQGHVYRPLAAVSGMTPYVEIIGKGFPIPTPLTQVNVQFGLGTDNTIRVIDGGYNTTAALAAGDVITVFALLGPREESIDTMN